MSPRHSVLWILGLFLLPTLNACLMTRDDISEQEHQKQVQEQVANLQKNTAESQTQYSEINDEIRELHGKIEVLENKISVNNKEHEKIQAATDQQLAETSKKLGLLQEEMQKLQNQNSFLNQELQKLATAAPVATAASNGKAGEKSNSFKNGEALFAKHAWKEAIVEYQKYRVSFPKGRSYPMASYKIGLCFQELGMRDEAKTFFEDLLTHYPDSPLVPQAKERLKKK